MTPIAIDDVALAAHAVAEPAGAVHPDYAAVRQRAALMDLSCEGRWQLTGTHALLALNRLFSLDLEIVPRWQGVSGLFLQKDASVIAIATVFRGDDSCYVFTEASTAQALQDYLCAELGGTDVTLTDLAESHDWLCLLGPAAQATMAAAAGDDILGMRYLSFEHSPTLGLPIFRMGSCGEYEYRMLCPKEQTQERIEDLLAAGRDCGIALADPAVLPLLMMEMRSLSRHDIPAGGNAVTLGMHWMVSFRKPSYPGSDALHDAKRSPEHRSLMLRFDQAGLASAGDRLEIDGTDLGFCVNVHFSPTVGTDIGLAYVDADFGWVGVPFRVVCARATADAVGAIEAIGVSAPLFVTKTVSAA